MRIRLLHGFDVGTAALFCVSMVVVPALGVVGGCATERPFVWVQDFPPPPGETTTVIHPRDTIVVSVRNQAALSGEFVVREDGGYLQPTVGNVAVAARTPTEVATELHARLADLIADPNVSVSIGRSAPVRVNVVGEVRTPGTYELNRDRTVTAALAAAGWITDFAAKDRIFVVRSGEVETRIRFRARELTGPEPRSARFRLRDGDVVVVE